MRKVLTSDILSPARYRWLHDKRVDEADNLIRYIYNQTQKTGRVNHWSAWLCGHNSGDCYDNYSSGKNDTSFFMEKATGDVQGQLLESFDEMGSSEPVVACGEPRLPLHLYP
ncbi:hypothetical protein SAY86_031620 [Trapa natans]|uniref:Uncharacterized protein n=1 Tax=Trapa natans TaxID=22666 RepID=A0AAN7R629_TRANT|nr:hypothetical protein SAY86_031620 [Trapa natans]